VYWIGQSRLSLSTTTSRPEIFSIQSEEEFQVGDRKNSEL
jgi:hypothetical protein